MELAGAGGVLCLEGAGGEEQQGKEAHGEGILGHLFGLSHAQAVQIHRTPGYPATLTSRLGESSVAK